MIIEHSIFFLLGALSIKIFDIILKNLMIRARKQEYADKKQSDNKKVLFKFTSTWSNIIRHVFKIKGIGYIWISISVLILAFWHIPQIFDASVLNEDIHVMQHISFIFVGITGYLSIRSLGDSYQIFLIFILSGMMGFGGLIFSLLDATIYSVYSVTAHNYAGTFMIVVSILLIFLALPIYVIKKTFIYIKTKA